MFGVLAGYSQQIYFNKTINFISPTIWCAASNIVETNNGYFIIGGTGHPLNYSWNQIGIAKIDEFGNKQWSKIIGDTIATYYSGISGSLKKAPISGYYLAGAKQCYDEITYGRGLVIRFDSIFDTLWMKDYGDMVPPIDTSINFNSMFINYDYSLVFCGTQQKLNVSESYFRLLFIKMDSSGNKFWEKSYGMSGELSGYSVIQTQDKGYVLGGYKYVLGNIQSHDPIVIKTDSIGNLEWQKILGSSYLDGPAYLCNSDDGNIIIGTNYADSASPGSDFSYNRINVIKMNYNGNEIWNCKYCTSRVNYIRVIKKCEEGGYIVGGYYFTWKPGYTGWLLRINDEGDSLWYREYSIVHAEYSSNYIYEVTPTMDKGFLIGGMIYPVPPDTGIQSAWVVKTDSLGCDTAGCDTTVGIPKIPVKEKTQCQIIPNPVVGTSKIKLPVNYSEEAIVLVYNYLGKLLFIKRYKPDEEIIIRNSEYKSGIYIYRINLNNKKYYSGKFVVL